MLSLARLGITRAGRLRSAHRLQPQHHRRARPGARSRLGRLRRPQKPRTRLL